MKGKQFTEEQIIGVLREHEAGGTASRSKRFTAGSRSTAAWGVGSAPSEGPGVGERQTEASSGGGASGQCGVEGSAIKKLAKPAARREAVGYLMDRHSHSQRRACRLVGLARSVAQYRRRPK